MAKASGSGPQEMVSSENLNVMQRDRCLASAVNLLLCGKYQDLISILYDH